MKHHPSRFRSLILINLLFIISLVTSSYTVKLSPKVLSLGTGLPYETARMGMNAGTGAMDWDPTEMFANVMMTFREVTRPDGTPVPIDAKGWPLSDCRFLVWHGLVRVNGIYHLRFTGNASTITADGATVQNVQHDSLTNTTTADVILSGANYLYLIFTGTTNGVKNVQLMMPGHNFGEIWNHDFLTAIQPVRVIRFMDFTATNWNHDVNWSDRTLPDAATQQSFPAGYGWQGKGIAWEYMIDLLNTTDKDGWINIPAEANDGYINGLIDLIKNGGNGFPPLEVDRKLYIEYSNEVWNGGFDQTQFNHEHAVAEVQAGNSPLNFDSETNEWYWAWRRVAKRIVEISNQFRAAFGDEQMMSRFRPVLAWQYNNGQATAETQLDFIQKYYGTNRWGYGDPHPVNYYLWGGGGALYSDDVPLAQDQEWKTAVEVDSKFAAAYGINFCNYEGGISFDGDNDPDWYASWVTQDVIDRQQYYEEHGGNLFVYYALVTDFEGLGLLKSIRNLNTPKYNAYLQLSQQAQAWENTFGASLPMHKDGADFSLSYPSWVPPGTGTATLSPNEGRSYHFDVNETGVYKVQVEFNSTSNINLGIFAGSEWISSVTTNSNGTPTTTAEYFFNLSKGLKAIRIENMGSNAFDIISVDVDLVQTPAGPVVLSSRRTGSDPSQLDSLDFVVIFSEPVTGVDKDDFALTVNGIINANITNVSGSGFTYIVSVDSGTGNGTIRLDLIDNDSILDCSLRPLGGPGSGNGNFSSGESFTKLTFLDVPLNHWAGSFIQRLYESGVTSGCSVTPLNYCPNALVTRGQMAVFLLRGEHGSTYTPPDATGAVFGDVPLGYWAGPWIEQLAAEGITGGCGNGNYCPDLPVTRDQMAVFLLRAEHGAAYIPPTPTGVFTDVPTDHWAAAWIEQLAVEGITGGCSASPMMYCPATVVNRAQMAVFLVRTFNLP